MSDRPTIQDVAKLAAVSPSTVSRTLSGRARVEDGKRERVLDAVRKLGYRPDGVARALRNGQVAVLGLLVPDIRNPFFAELVQGTEDAAFAAGYTLFVGSSNEDARREGDYFKAFVGHRVSGLLIATSRGSSYLQELREKSIPTVLLARGLRNPPPNWVGTDHRLGAAIAARHLLELGHRHMMLLTGPTSIDAFGLRKEGFLDEAVRAGAVAEVTEGPVGVESGYKMVRTMLARRSAVPTAYFAASDLLAIGVMKALAESGREIPKDASVIGFDGLEIGSYVSPSLTTVAQSGYEVGRIGCERLLQLLKEDATPFEPAVLRPELLLRGSTAPPP